MERWCLYWQVTETRGRFKVVGTGVARPGQGILEGTMEIGCPGGKEESIWLYRAVLGTLPDGTVRLVLYDRSNPGETRVVLGAGPEGSPTLAFSDKAGKVIWSAP